MAFDRKARSSERGASTETLGGSTPGKRTLVEASSGPASPASQASPATARGGGGAIQRKAELPHDARHGAEAGAGATAQAAGSSGGALAFLDLRRVQRKPDAQGSEQGDPDAPLDPRGASIAGLLESFQSVGVTVPVPAIDGPADQAWASPAEHTVAHVTIPYWNNRYVKEVGGERLTPPAGFDQSARTTALNRLGIGLDSGPAVGKGRPEEIGQIASRAVAEGLVARPPYAPVATGEHWAAAWKPMIEAWLLRVGVGLDCSGFVYQALHEVRRETGAETLREAAGKIGALDYFPNEQIGRTLASDEAMAGHTKDELGQHVDAPGDLQVADTMYFNSHIRIVIRVDRTQVAEGITSFDTAESTAAGRFSADGAVDGPRVHHWRYEGAALSHRYEGATLWETSGEQPTYRRHLGPAPAATSAGTGTAQRKAAAPHTGGAHGTTGAAIGAATGAATGVTAASPAAPAAAAGPGEPLPAPTRLQMERSLGADFSGVRVHQGGAAPALGALAFADGEDLHFAPGRFQPGSRAGDELIGHELAHVVQQRAGRVGSPQGKHANVVDDPALEAEADRLGAAAAAAAASTSPAPDAAASTGTDAAAAPAPDAAASTGTGTGTDAAAAPAPAHAPPAPTGGAVQRKQDPGGGGGGGGELGQAPGGFDAMLTEIDGALAAREPGGAVPLDQIRPAISALVAWCRANLPDEAQVRAYLASDVAREEKTRTIGLLGDELARMEFMLGGLFNGAIAGASWRGDERSASLFPGTYLAAAGGLAANLDWCTSFAGYGFGRLGADDDVTDHVGSGPKQRAHGAVVFPQDSWTLLRALIAYWAADPTLGGVTSIGDLVQQFIADAPAVLERIDPLAADGGRTPFEQHLYNTGASSRVVTSMKSRAVPTAAPSPGDLLILNTRGPAVGTNDDHTAMIDRFAFPTLSTIEGNLGDTTGTRQLALDDPEHLAQIYFISRPAQQIVEAHAASATTGGDPTGGDPGAGAAQLAELRSHNQRLHAVFSKLASGAGAASPDGPAHDWPR